MFEIAVAGAAASNTPVTLTAPLVLVGHSIVMGAGVELDCGGSLRCRGNLHVLGMAESGTGKSEAAKVILAPIKEVQQSKLDHWDREERPRHVARAAILRREQVDAEKKGDQCSLARIIRQRDDAELAASEKGRPLLYAADVTREALSAALALAPLRAFAVLNPDARGQIGIIAGKYSAGKATDEDIYLAGYSGDAMSSLRVGSGFVNVEQPCLTTCLLIQPDVFNDLRQKAIFAQSGWLQRNLIFDSQASFAPLSATPAAVPVEVMAEWREHLINVLEFVRGAESSTLVVPTEESRTMMLEKRNAISARMESGDLRDVASFACRWAEQANRIALNLHVARFRNPEAAASIPLEASTLEDAWAITDWFAAEQLRLLLPMRSERKHARCNRLVDLLVRHGINKQLPRWKLKDHGYDEVEIQLLATEFPARLTVGETPSTPKGGRPPKWVQAVGG